MTIRLSEFAKRNGVCYHTAWRWYRAGRISGAFLSPGGKVHVDVPDERPKPTLTVVYCRVSSSQNRANLESQARRVSDFCAARGWVVDRVVKEVGSGLNDTRRGLSALLVDPTVRRIVVEHRDRLTRFGFNYIKNLFHGDIVVVNEAESDRDDLMGDFVSVVTSFCARLYGLRRSRRRTERLIAELADKDAE